MRNPNTIPNYYASSTDVHRDAIAARLAAEFDMPMRHILSTSMRIARRQWSVDAGCTFWEFVERAARTSAAMYEAF